MKTNARLAVVVGSVAVMAIAVGSAVAYRQVPSLGTSAATPLPALSTPTPQISKTPSGTPSTPSSTPKPVPATTPTLAPTTPTPVWTGPVKVPVNLAKLGKGADPQIPYLVGRVVRGGDGPARAIPGTDTIGPVVRSGIEVLAVVSDLSRSRLVRLGQGDKATYTADVTSLVSGDSRTVAYTAVPSSSRGGTVYYEHEKSVFKVEVPATALGLEVLRLKNDNVVYYRWRDSAGGPWKLFQWIPGSRSAPEPEQVKAVVSADVVSDDGMVAGSISNSAPAEGSETCSTVTLLANSKRLWRTCDSWVEAFTPDHSATISTGGRGDEGTATSITAQETATGKVIREWTGAFEVVVPEDDQHVLVVAKSSIGDPRRSIIRCDITTGSCELAVGLTSSYLSLSKG